jgi:hypothetical protein
MTAFLVWLLTSAGTCSAQSSGSPQIESWITNRDRSSLFQKQAASVVFRSANDTQSANSFTVQYKGEFANFKLDPGAVGTYVW